MDQRRLFQQKWTLAGAILVLITLLAACTSSKSENEAGSAAIPPSATTTQSIGHNPAPNPSPGEGPEDLPLKSLSVADFMASFRYRERPTEIVIPSDFDPKIDRTLQHYDRVEVILGDGKRTELRMQSFGAWAIYKNFDGNYEMLTTMVTGIGPLMHLHTLNSKFETLGSIEIARLSYIDGDETVKKGKFSDWDNYHYTTVTRNKGVLLDSANGHIIMATSGNYKVLEEIR